MLKIIILMQCDVCGELFEKIAQGSTAAQNSCAFLAGGIIVEAGMDGWFFNSKTRQAWCTDCIVELASNEKLPPVAEIVVPGYKSGSNDSVEDLPF